MFDSSSLFFTNESNFFSVGADFASLLLNKMYALNNIVKQCNNNNKNKTDLQSNG